MNYYEKYIKYKIKYLNLLKGGGNIEEANFDLNELEENFREKYKNGSISNLGQHNCGILFYKNYVIKCLGLESEDEKKKYENENNENIIICNRKLINDKLKGLYPLFFIWPGKNNIYHYIFLKENTYALCIIMERLDGDLTNYILETAYKNTYPNGNDYKYMYDRLPKTMEEFIDKDQKSECIVNEISDNLIKLLITLEPKLIKLHHDLVLKGWTYHDLKLDNIGYKIIDDKIKLYFIDEESGLKYYDPEEDIWTNYLDYHWTKTLIFEYGILGQYSLKSIGVKKIPDNELIQDLLSFKEKDEIINKLANCKLEKTSDTFRWLKFRCENNNDFFVIQKILINKYRLVRFDDNSRHLSNPKYRERLKKIDIIYDNLEDLYCTLKEIYPEIKII